MYKFVHVFCSGIDEKIDVYVYDQYKLTWFRYSYINEGFVKCELPYIMSDNFTGIGTREINEFGIKAIEEVLIKTKQEYDKRKNQ